MNAAAKIPSETERSTIPQHMLDRIENEWHQMRANALAQPKPFQPSNDKT